ncbi:methyltransferase domain-containing protein [Acetobacter sp. LMG 1627]|uniref:Methyltransferase domain-containing protein n=2 Tax=Acetobacter conturbans TaxID=1737472 RepID=A0ABX0JXF0_9PROT|nr:N-6 DNA methylase [Acetobacter conturbans]NHN88172.1 methyltransferase domain-containing protein [Acetobacter conturbans]
MAALVPARPGERVLEAGCGAGAGLLCLTARIHGLTATGVELDPETAALVRANLILNERTGVEIVHGDISDAPAMFRNRAPGFEHRFDHVFANPPWHRVDTTPSPESKRDRARRAGKDTCQKWIATLASLLRQKGSLTLALPTSRLAEALAVCERVRIGSTEIVPLWAHREEEARIILVRGRLGGNAGSRILPGLVLHQPNGSFTPEAEAILRAGHPLFPNAFRKACPAPVPPPLT